MTTSRASKTWDLSSLDTNVEAGRVAHALGMAVWNQQVKRAHVISLGLSAAVQSMRNPLPLADAVGSSSTIPRPGGSQSL